MEDKARIEAQDHFFRSISGLLRKRIASMRYPLIATNGATVAEVVFDGVLHGLAAEHDAMVQVEYKREDWQGRPENLREHLKRAACDELAREVIEKMVLLVSLTPELVTIRGVR